MPSMLRIPPRYLPGLEAIAALPDKAIKDLEAALASVPSSLTTERLAEHVARVAPQISDRALETTEALLSLIALLPEEGGGASNLAADVAHSEDLKLTSNKRNSLAKRLVTLLNLECLSLAARAYDIVTEYEKAFHDREFLPIYAPSSARMPPRDRRQHS